MKTLLTKEILKEVFNLHEYTNGYFIDGHCEYSFDLKTGTLNDFSEVDGTETLIVDKIFNQNQLEEVFDSLNLNYEK